MQNTELLLFTSIQRPRRQLLRRPRSPVAKYLEKLAREQERQAVNWNDEQSSDSRLILNDEETVFRK